MSFNDISVFLAYFYDFSQKKDIIHPDFIHYK